MKKDEFVNEEITKTNEELNKKKNKDSRITPKKGASSSTEANLAMQEEFYSDNSPEDVTPTYISNGTQATFIDEDK